MIYRQRRLTKQGCARCGQLYRDILPPTTKPIVEAAMDSAVDASGQANNSPPQFARFLTFAFRASQTCVFTAARQRRNVARTSMAFAWFNQLLSSSLPRHRRRRCSSLSHFFTPIRCRIECRTRVGLNIRHANKPPLRPPMIDALHTPLTAVLSALLQVPFTRFLPVYNRWSYDRCWL